MGADRFWETQHSWQDQAYDFKKRVAELEAALATERAARSRAEKRAEILETCHAPSRRVEQAEYQRDTALAREAAVAHERDVFMARVKELETQGCEHVMPGFPICDRCGKSARTIAAETALASARELLEDAWKERHAMKTSWCTRYREWLTSHPAPVAAPEDE